MIKGTDFSRVEFRDMCLDGPCLCKGKGHHSHAALASLPRPPRSRPHKEGSSTATQIVALPKDCGWWREMDNGLSMVLSFALAPV